MIYDSIFFNDLSQQLPNFQGMSAKNDSLLPIEEILRIYTYSKYLDRNVQWVLFILAEYRYILDEKHDILAQ